MLSNCLVLLLRRRWYTSSMDVPSIRMHFFVVVIVGVVVPVHRSHTIFFLIFLSQFST